MPDIGPLDTGAPTKEGLRKDSNAQPNYSSMPKDRSDPSSFQPPPGYEIGGDAPADRNPKRKALPALHDGCQEPSDFQPPMGMIDTGGDLPMGDSLQGMTDNVLAGASLAEVKDGCMALGDNPSIESLNPSEVDGAEKPLPPGFLDRSNGWER